MTFTLWHIIGAAAIVALIVAVAASVRTRQKDIRKVAYMMDALEDGELNFRFRDNSRFNRTLNRIRTIFEKQRQQQEQDSWAKLIRVLTHEIMNTVAPITSLSDALSKSMDEDGHSDMDVKAGLDVICDSSKNLIRFVETYRELSGVARPVKKVVDVRKMMDKVIGLEKELLASGDAHCSYSAETEDMMIYADEGQISRIFINLVKNALQAGARHIRITAALTRDDETVLCVANDGEPIPLSCQEQIFVPFFTTKKDGSGIGLSLARQIMRQHNGSIDLVKSDGNETVFRLVFR